ncbi:hypothetical protein Lal_00013812 [Lupinus albus]|nr:hypothetical protein Lal_00013812 [Lupinus albus]
MAVLRIDRIHADLRRHVSVQHADQLAACQRLSAQEGRRHDEADAGRRRLAQQVGGRHVGVDQAAVADQLVRGLRHAVLLQIGRAGAQRHPRGGQPPGDQRAVAQPADPHRQIVPLVDQIDRAVVQVHVDLDGRVALQELRHRRGQMHDAEADRCVQPQPATRGGMQVGDRLLRLLQIGEDSGAALVIGLAHLGQAELAGGAVQEPRAEPVLQLADAAGDHRLRQVEPVGGGGEALGVHHLDEGEHVVEAIHGIVVHPETMRCQDPALPEAPPRPISCVTATTDTGRGGRKIDDPFTQTNRE